MRAVYSKPCVGIALLLAACLSALAQDSLGMRMVSSLSYWQGIYDLQMAENLAYIVSGPSSLRIIDVSDQAHPAEIGRYTWFLENVGGSIYVTGNRAYLTTPAGGTVLDVTDSTHPANIGQWSGNWSSVTLVHGNWGIAGFADGYPRVMDVSDPANVHQISNFPDIIDPADALGMAGEYLVMQHFPGGILVYDMSNPALPVRVAACDTMTSRSRYGTIAGDHAYLATFYDGLHIIDLSNPLQPTLVAACDTNCFDVAVLGDHAVVSSGIMASYGLRIWNVSDPSRPVLEGNLPVPPGSNGFGRVSGTGHLVCVDNWGEKFANFVDIANPATPTLVSEMGDNGVLKRLAVSGGTGYIADARVGLRTVNVENPSQITELANLYHRSPGAWNPAVDSGYVYLSLGPHGVSVVDISSPAQPETLRTIMPAELRNIIRVMLYGEYLYAFDTGIPGGSSLLHVFSLADPANPQWVDSVAILDLDASNSFGSATANGNLYLADQSGIGPGIFKVFSLADPAAPQSLGYCILPLCESCTVYSVAAAGEYAYVSYGDEGALIINVENPSIPAIVGQTGDFSSGVAAADSILFIDELHRISIMDLTNPVNPMLIGYYPTDEWLEDMQIAGRYLFTTSESELRIYQVDAITSVAGQARNMLYEFALEPCYPNPFNPSSVISFSLPKDEHAKLTIYNVTGRQIQVLIEETLKAGEHHVTFDGSSLPSGIYFARLMAGQQIQTQKMILMK